MAKRVQFIRHTTGNADAFTGLEGEITVDITEKTLRVHDGVNAGGTELAKADATNIQEATTTQNGKMTAVQVQQLENAIPKVNPAVAGNFALQQADGTLTDSGIAKRYAEFPAGTKMVFAQAVAPTGWTQDTANDDAALRVVAASGGGVGGVHGLSSPPATAHTHTIPDHSHTVASHSHSYTLLDHDHYMPIEAVGVDAGGFAGCKTVVTRKRRVSGLTLTNGEGLDGTFTGDTDGTTTANTGASCPQYRYYTYGARSLPSANTSSEAPGTSTEVLSADSNGPTPFQPKYVDVIIATKDAGLT